MSEGQRTSEIADWGSGEDRPPPPPRDRRGIWLPLITAGVVLTAACSAVTAWTVVGMREDGRVLDCYYRLGVDFNEPEENLRYEDMTPGQRAVADRLDCDVPGR